MLIVGTATAVFATSKKIELTIEGVVATDSLDPQAWYDSDTRELNVFMHELGTITIYSTDVESGIFYTGSLSVDLNRFFLEKRCESFVIETGNGTYEGVLK